MCMLRYQIELKMCQENIFFETLYYTTLNCPRVYILFNKKHNYKSLKLTHLFKFVYFSTIYCQKVYFYLKTQRITTVIS